MLEDKVGIFNFDVRVVTCKNCGAPLRAEIAGGLVTCEYCGVVNRLSVREGACFVPTTLSESERMAALRLATGNEAPIPALEFVEDGKVPSYFLRKAKEQWQSLRAQLETSNVFVLKEKLFYLTAALVPSLDPAEQRAFLETAVGILDDERYRQILQCQMARAAARNGEVKAAKSWLAQCNPRACDLESDTAYRYTAATLAAVHRDTVGIHEQLGFEEGEVPFARRDLPAARMLRIHAKELQGKIREAGGELLCRIEQVGLAKVQSEIKRHLPLAVCTASLDWAKAQLHAAQAERAARAQADWEEKQARDLQQLRTTLAALPVMSWRRFVETVAVAFIASVAAGWILVLVAVITETDPVFGLAAKIACANACEGCAPPIRTISWTTTHDAFDEETTTSIFCDDPTHTIQQMDKGQLSIKAAENNPAVTQFRISDWSLLRITMIVYGPIIFGFVLLIKIRSRRSKRAEIMSRIAELEMSPPKTDPPPIQ